MMRKLLTFLQAVAIATLIAGCGGTGTENEPEITPEIKFTEDIVTSGISVESAEQSITLSFSTNVAWSATTSADWITISPSSGAAGKNSVKIKVEENTESKQRTATITIKTTDGKCTASIKVTQGKDKIIFEDANSKPTWSPTSTQTETVRSVRWRHWGSKTSMSAPRTSHPSLELNI